MKGEQYFKELINGERCGSGDRLLLLFLRICSYPYSLVMRLRALAYSCGLLRSYRLPRPVVSVGNIASGGTGKTPVTAWVAASFIGHGRKVAVLTRGYGGTLEGSVAVVADGRQRLLTAAEAGDEPCLLADMVPGLIVVMGSRRYEAGMLALERFSPDIFILDDGFQHLRLQRDLDLVLLDAARPLGNGYTLPAGLLREGFSAVKRAGVVIFTRCDRYQQPPVDLPAGLPVVMAAHRLAGYRSPGDGFRHSFSELAGRQGLAFAGIADPGSFFDALEAAGLRLSATLAFPDHTRYGEVEVAALAALRRSSKPDYLITTAKDAVKLGSIALNLPFYIADLEMVFHNELSLRTELDKLL